MPRKKNDSGSRPIVNYTTKNFNIVNTTAPKNKRPRASYENIKPLALTSIMLIIFMFGLVFIDMATMTVNFRANAINKAIPDVLYNSRDMYNRDYKIYEDSTLNITYDAVTGIYTVNGYTTSNIVTPVIISDIYYGYIPNTMLLVNVYKVSGISTVGEFKLNLLGYSLSLDHSQEYFVYTNGYGVTSASLTINATIASPFVNYKFKLQIEDTKVNYTYNLAMPDLTGKTQISPNVYRLQTVRGITVDYSVKTGTYILNGVFSDGSSTIGITSLRFEMSKGYHTLSFYYVDGNVNNNDGLIMQVYDGVWKTNTTSGNSINYFVTYDFTQDNNTRYYYLISTVGTVFNNYSFKIQIEEGIIQTPYVKPIEFTKSRGYFPPLFIKYDFYDIQIANKLGARMESAITSTVDFLIALKDGVTYFGKVTVALLTGDVASLSQLIIEPLRTNALDIVKDTFKGKWWNRILPTLGGVKLW